VQCRANVFWCTPLTINLFFPLPNFIVFIWSSSYSKCYFCNNQPLVKAQNSILECVILSADSQLRQKIGPSPVAALSKAWVCGRWLAGDCEFESRRGHEYLLWMLVCQVQVSASDRSLIQRNHTKCGVSECDREASIMRGPWPNRGCCTMAPIIYAIGSYEIRKQL
jgi:hypothetical protein